VQVERKIKFLHTFLFFSGVLVSKLGDFEFLCFRDRKHTKPTSLRWNSSEPSLEFKRAFVGIQASLRWNSNEPSLEFKRAFAETKTSLRPFSWYLKKIQYGWYSLNENPYLCMNEDKKVKSEKRKVKNRFTLHTSR